MAIPQIIAALGSFVSMTASRVIASVASRKLANPPNQAGLAKRGENEQLRKAEAEYLRGKANREQELVKLQSDLATMREIEIKAGMEIAAAQADREERALEISEKDLQLKKQALQLAKERLQQESNLAEAQQQQAERALQLRERELEILAEERAARLQLSYLHLQLVQEHKAKDIDLKLQEIQAEWDKENWAGVLSREEMRQILREGREKHRLLMLVSPPDIEGCPEFDSNLHKAVRSELKQFMEKYYPLQSELCPVEFYGKFFKSSVFDIEVKQYERNLAPIPTVVIYSDVTNDKVYFHVHVWGLAELVPLTLTWDWREERDKLEASEGKTRDESLRIIQDAIVKSHQLLAAFFADLYYLQINPAHEIRLFQLEGDFPSEWLQSQFEALSNLQQQMQATDGDDLMNSDEQNLVNLSDSLPTPRLAVRMRDESQKIEDGSPSVYRLPVRTEMEDTKKLISKCHIGEPSPFEVTEKVLMVVGATGAGKTTLINGMVNYILGVEWEDDFRFKLIADEAGKSQAHSQTKLITAYTLHKMEGSPLPYKLTIIDTPGFGDTEGLKRDRFITNQIREFFSIPNGIAHLDGIGFVTQSSLARLTPTQQYIFDSILSVFGKDVADNIFIMATFADAQKPPVMEAINAAKVPYAKFFKFNNSALFADNIPGDTDDEADDEDDADDNFDKMFWKMGVKSFQKFFTELAQAESKSLQLTKDVLQERKQLEATVNGLLPQIRAAQLKLNELLREEAVMIKFKDQIEANKNFTWEDTETKQRKIDLEKGEHVTNCLTCNRTCHYPCFIPDDREKYNCSAMKGDQSNAICTVCGHDWHKHFNNTYRFELYQVKVQKTYDELKRRYQDGIQGKIKVESVIKCLNDDLEKVCETIFQMIQQVQQCLRRLDEIALKPNPITQVEYIDQLIETEKLEAKFEWEQRVRYYQEAREFAVTLSRAQDAANVKKEADIKQWAKKLIAKLKNEKIQEIESALSAPPQGKSATPNSQSWLTGLKRTFFE